MPEASLCQQLRYAPRLANRPQQAMQRAGSTRAGSWLFQRTLYRVDRPLYRWTNGRITLPGALTGIPVVMLTTSGAKTGLARTMPVAGIPDRGDIVLMGTNYAQERTPAWAINLGVDPRCSLQYRSRTALAIAEPVIDPDERDALWAEAGRYYTGFPSYRSRITHREVRIFRLRGYAP